MVDFGEAVRVVLNRWEGESGALQLALWGERGFLKVSEVVGLAVKACVYGVYEVDWAFVSGLSGHYSDGLAGLVCLFGTA